MGRKIPAKKHRGVKDPLEQQARRFESIKGKINAPPKDPDEQPVPRSLTRLFAFQDREKKIKKKKTPKRASSSTDGGPASGVGENPLARLKKLPGESGREFSLRINGAIRALHDPLEKAYAQDLEADDVKGEQMAAQRARRRRKRARGASGEDPEPQQKPSRAQKLALKRNAMKMKAAEDARGEALYESVAFGEVASAPPALAPPRRCAPAPGAPRPGARGLLLGALLAGGAEPQRRERARLAAVAAYRDLNRQKRIQQHTKRKNNQSNKKKK